MGQGVNKNGGGTLLLRRDHKRNHLHKCLTEHNEGENRVNVACVGETLSLLIHTYTHAYVCTYIYTWHYVCMCVYK